MSSNTRVTNLPTGSIITSQPVFVQMCEVAESSLFGGGNPMLTYLMGIMNDGTLYKLSKSDRKWEKWGGV